MLRVRQGDTGVVGLLRVAMPQVLSADAARAVMLMAEHADFERCVCQRTRVTAVCTGCNLIMFGWGFVQRCPLVLCVSRGVYGCNA